MREYVAQLPDYTCRLTMERFRRARARAPLERSDRLRLEVAYTGGQELYSWPGDDRFEAGIWDLAPGHGLVSSGSYALHLRNLFVRDVAEFAEPREEECEGRPCLRLDFHIPAMRSGYSLSAGNGSAAAELVGSAWFDAGSLDIRRLEVRVDDAPPGVRIAATRETTVYTRARIGKVEFVVPAKSELMLRDRDGSESLNRMRFDQYRRFAGSATVTYGPPEDAAAAAAPLRETAPRTSERVATQLTASLDTEIGEGAAIGDVFTAVTADGVQVKGRITDLRRAGKRWLVELTLSGLVCRWLELPLKARTRISWQASDSTLR
jgi:hypothetical protein